MSQTKRKAPNILITGSPGVGKSSLCQKLVDLVDLQWLEISKVAIENGCCQEYDPIYQCPVLDEDKLLDGLEGIMSKGGTIVDYHSCELFPERWFDIVFVLRTNNTVLYDRLVARGYSGTKLDDNIRCEIFQTILDEAQEAYRSDIVVELDNTTQDQLQDNVMRICQWLQDWFK